MNHGRITFTEQNGKLSNPRLRTCEQIRNLSSWAERRISAVVRKSLDL